MCRRLVQRITVSTGTKTRQIFFSYVCNGKGIEELFASALNGITASVRCVSSITPVVPDARLRANKRRRGEMKNTEDSDSFSKLKHNHQTPVAVLPMREIISLLYVSMIHAGQ